MALEAVTKLEEGILAEAEAEARRRVAEAEEEAKRIIERAKAEAEEQVASMKAAVEREMAEVERRRLSEARRACAMKKLAVKNELIEECFSKALQKLREVVNTDAYVKGMATLMERSIAQLGSEEVRVRFNDRDAARFQNTIASHLKLPSNVKIVVEPEREACIGGFVISTPDGKIKINNTLEARLELVKRTLRKELGKILFG